MLGAKDQHSKQFAAKMKTPGLRYSARHRLAILRRVMLSALLLVSGIAAQETGPALRGNWTATTGTGTFQGSWGAEISASNRDSAQGYWTLVNDAGERVLQGTWSAKKTSARWRGNWTARTAQGGSVFGTWEADATGLNGKTLADMFALTLEREVTGSWQGGRHSGSWRLSGAKGQPGSR